MYLLGFIFIALLAKDTIPIGDNYVLRGLSQGTALCVGGWWILAKSEFVIWKKYGLLLAYLGVLLLTAGGAQQPIAVLLQLGSLLAVIVFFISCMEGHPDVRELNPKAIRIASMALILVCLGSLVVYRISPMVTFDLTSEAYDGIRRFRGVFGKPAQMGAAAGVLLGLSLFSNDRLLFRFMGIAVSAPCLYMTGSRSFWAGAILAMMGTAVFYIKRKAIAVVIGLVSVAIVALLVMAGNVQISPDTEAKLLRKDSLENMSGRSKVWDAALVRFMDRPILGYGFSQGHTAFEESSEHALPELSANADSAPNGGTKYAATLHSGYVQALLDSGALGFGLYVVMIIFSIWSVLRHDKKREFGTVLYALIFLSVSNGAESIIFTAAEFHSVFYWYAAVLAFSLPCAMESVREEHRTALPEPLPSSRRYPLLSSPPQPTTKVQ
jgi:O-antigen ligase